MPYRHGISGWLRGYVSRTQPLETTRASVIVRRSAQKSSTMRGSQAQLPLDSGKTRLNDVNTYQNCNRRQKRNFEAHGLGKPAVHRCVYPHGLDKYTDQNGCKSHMRHFNSNGYSTAPMDGWWDGTIATLGSRQEARQLSAHSFVLSHNVIFGVNAFKCNCQPTRAHTQMSSR